MEKTRRPTPREAKLFYASSGSAVRGFLKFNANIPPRWIKNAKASRKRLEPEIVRIFGDLKRLRKTRPNALVTINKSRKELKTALDLWETAYKNRGLDYHSVAACVAAPCIRNRECEYRVFRSEGPTTGFGDEWTTGSGAMHRRGFQTHSKLLLPYSGRSLSGDSLGLVLFSLGKSEAAPTIPPEKTKEAAIDFS